MLLRFRLILLLVVGALLLPSIVGARQDAPPVTIQVHAGYEKVYRTTQWFPITIDVTNSGPDITNAILEWHFIVQSDNMVVQRRIDLPQGANKRVVLAAFSDSFARSGEVRLLNGTNEILRQPVQLEPVDTRKFMVGVLSNDPAFLNNLRAMTLATDSTTNVAHLTPQQLPDNALLLYGLDALFVHDIATTDLSQEQRDALLLWVRMGGQLIVSGGPVSDRNSVGLEEILPADIGGLQSNVSLDPLTNVVAQPLADVPKPTTVNELQLRSGAQSLAGNNLLVARREGVGRVLFTAFDLSALRDWAGEPAFWGSVLQFNDRLLPGTIYRQQRDDPLRTVLQLPELNLPSAGSLLLFIMMYILVIGPVNYLVLRRIKRPELAWVTIPATVLVFVVGTYIYGIVVRGGQPQVAQMTIVQGVEGQAHGQATGFIGLFSPQRRSYNLDFADETLVSEVRSFNNEGGDTTVLWTDTGTTLPDTLVDVSSLRTFMFERGVDVPVQVSSAMQKSDRQLAGTVVNSSSEPLEDAVVVWGDAAQALGTLAPGASATVDLNARLRNFPDGDFAGTEGRINRRNVLESLFGTTAFPAFGTSTFSQGMPDREGIYLLGWRSQPVTDITLDGARASQEGATLYVVRLNVE